MSGPRASQEFHLCFFGPSGWWNTPPARRWLGAVFYVFSARPKQTKEVCSSWALNVPIEHHPTIRYMVYHGYYKVMSNIPKMGHLPTPVHV